MFTITTVRPIIPWNMKTTVKPGNIEIFQNKENSLQGWCCSESVTNDEQTK